MNLKLFEHNRQAYEAAVNLMKETGKAAVIHPTGTGKSFIAFQLAADYPERKIFWLSPSEYIYQTQLENLTKTLEGAENADLDYLKSQIQFFTYSKLMMNEDEIKTLKPDFIILDEFHRCGAAEWGRSVKKLLDFYPQAKVLGLSATNIRYLDNCRDMVEELFDGCIASRMSLGEAIAKNILPAPTYVISMYSYQEEMKRLQKRIEANKFATEKNTILKEKQEKILEQLRRSLEQADGLDVVFKRHMKKKNGKYLVFCADKKHMTEMISHVEEWFRFVDSTPHIYRVYYDNPTTSQDFEDFKADKSEHLKLLFCIDMLNEGVHVEGIDGVILLRPTASPILYFQQIGRALNTGKGKDFQPIIFDIVNNFDSLYSIDALKKEFEESIRMIPCTETEQSKYHDAFHIIDELLNVRTLFGTLADSLNVSWNTYYIEAKKYFEQNANLKVPKKYVTEQGLNLGMWLATQRRVYAGKVVGILTEEQIQKLEDIGMDWENSLEQKFKEGFAALVTYQNAYGNTDVNINYRTEEGYALGRWVSNIRTAYKKGKLELRRIQLLNEIGMIWDVREYRWDRSYEAVAAYYEINGDLNMPQNYVDEKGNSLIIWLRNQKNTFNGKTNSTPLTQEQMHKLEALGLQWTNKYEDRWQKWYELAELYYKEHGDLKVSSTYCMKGEALGKWLYAVRLARKIPESSNRKLTEERIRQLDAIGMLWD